MSTSNKIFTHEVLLSGESIKRFQSLREAQWFCEGKTDAEIRKLEVVKTEKKSDYENAYQQVGECLF